MDPDVLEKLSFYGEEGIPGVNRVEDLKEKIEGKREVFIKICRNTPQLCWGDEWPILSPGGHKG